MDSPKIMIVEDRPLIAMDPGCITNNKNSITSIAYIGKKAMKFAAEITSGLIYEWDLSVGRLSWFGDIENKLGYKTDEMPGAYEYLAELIHPDDRQAFINSIADDNEKAALLTRDYRVMKKNSSWLYIEERRVTVVDKEGIPCKLIGYWRDITDKNEASKKTGKSDELIKKTDLKLQRTLLEKNILLREIHDRVKNNMQIISSIIDMESENIFDKRDKKFFINCQSRIHTMALIHEMIYRSPDMSKIDFSEYARSLSSGISHSLYPDPGKIKITIGKGGVFLDVNSAIPCGLIVNELFTNSIKYAFPGGQGGNIIIDLYIDMEENYNLSYKDTGIGFPENFNHCSPNTLGLEIVNSLIKQINGRLVFDNRMGSHFKIIFPVPKGLRK